MTSPKTSVAVVQTGAKQWEIRANDSNKTLLATTYDAGTRDILKEAIEAITKGSFAVFSNPEGQPVAA